MNKLNILITLLLGLSLGVNAQQADSSLYLTDVKKELNAVWPNKAMLLVQIQEEGLRTYLFTYAPYYDTLAVSVLASMFELDERKVAAVVSKMIAHEELAAALDQVNSAIIFRKGVELSRLQSLALTLSDKASNLIESNEKTLEQRTSGMEHRFERQGGQRGRGGRGGRGGMRGGGGQRTRGGQQFGGGALGSAIKA